MNESRWVIGLIAAPILAWLVVASRGQHSTQPTALAAPAATTLGPAFGGGSAESLGAYEAAHGDADCTQDCSGHEAGYKWAEEHDIADEDDCTGNSESFIEGCKAYVADNA
jgi:hypothetical protein